MSTPKLDRSHGLGIDHREPTASAQPHQALYAEDGMTQLDVRAERKHRPMTEHEILALLDTDQHPRPDGAELLTRRDWQAVNDVHAECGSEIGAAFELRLITERSSLVERHLARSSGHKDADDVRGAMDASGGDEDAVFARLFTWEGPS